MYIYMQVGFNSRSPLNLMIEKGSMYVYRIIRLFCAQPLHVYACATIHITLHKFNCLLHGCYYV